MCYNAKNKSNCSQLSLVGIHIRQCHTVGKTYRIIYMNKSKLKVVKRDLRG